jgi:hypothetical protein
MTALHVESRPFPGAPPAPPRDLAGAATSALAAARRRLSEPPAEHPADCRCSVWCRDEWAYAGVAIGVCEACGELCRSTDPEGRPRHPSCDRRRGA